MKFVLFILLVFSLKGIFLTNAVTSDSDVIYVNGGIACGACTILVGLIEQVAEVHNETVTNMMAEICRYLPGEYSMFCDILVHLWGPAIIEKIARHETPDVVCYSLGICHVDPGQSYCHLYPLPPGGMEYAVTKSRQESKVLPFFHWTLVERLPSACELPGVRQLCKNIQSSMNNMKPFLDLDKDKYSIMETFRGDAWRGKDCDDVNEMVYPGRKPMDRDIIMDSNCNGIFGIHNGTGQPYEDEFCSNTGQRGVIYIGDSIGAHFHVPPEWITASQLSMDILQNFTFVLGNELDWPHASFPTGFVNVTWPIVKGYTDSVYLRLRNRNLCNHRDFQNICFNGATSETMLQNLKSIARNSNDDHPVIAFYAMMGNDVCRRYMSSVDDLTTPEEFRTNVLGSLDVLNQSLPSGSHVLLMGLVDGAFIYDTMVDRIHPVGELHKNVRYYDIFEWFNCMRIGPCYGWMNKNESYRNATSKRALELTEVLQDIAENEKYATFKVHYLSNPLKKVIDQWVGGGRDLWEFLEPVDSMHPVQEALPMIAETIWDEIYTNYPEVLGDINPNNDMIKKVFGDQGGH